MKHYQIEQWLDFVHGFVGEAEENTMQEHLRSQCSTCQATVAWLRNLITLAVADARYEVPESALRRARAVYALQRPERVRLLPKLMAQLVFDSFREPLPAGVRSRQRITRQAMYEAGDYSVDLRLEHERGATTVVLVGQIANRALPEHGVAGIPIVLTTGETVLGRARSNEFGEFQMEYEPRQPLCLHVPVELAGQQIEVPLQELFDQTE